MKKIFLLLPIIFLFIGCGKSDEKNVMQIAFDPSWRDLNLIDQQPWVTGYLREVMGGVAKAEHFNIKLSEQNGALLMAGLKEGKYDGIVTTLMPTNFREAHMTFSDSILATGPVLIVRMNSEYHSVSDLVRKEVGVIDNDTGIYVGKDSPKAYILNYTSDAAALQDLADGVIEGVVIDRIHALGYVQNLYLGKLKIVGAPITDEGVRIVSMKKDPKELIVRFNRAWKKLREENKMEALLRKWKLIETMVEEK